MKNIYNGTVVTCRVRLARNLSGYNFASTLTDRAKAKEIINRTYSLISRFGQFDLYEMSKISPQVAERLKERYIISEALKKNTFSGAVAVEKSERLSVMINEEDHVREQCVLRGEDLVTAYNKLFPLDRWLNNNLRFCKNPSYGYITACPTNLGTGLRASAMMFLPTLARNDMINNLYSKATQRGLTVRGVFGEGSNGESCLYQVSNEVTLGKKEEDIIKEVQHYVEEVADIEQVNALSYYNQNKLKVEDDCYRSLAILTGCKLLSYKEFATLIANVKWGACLNLIKISDFMAIDDLIISVRPATLRSAIQDYKSGDNRVIDGFMSENNAKINGDENARKLLVEGFRAEYVKNSLKKIIL